MNEQILMPVDTSDPLGKGVKVPTVGSGGQSQSHEGKDGFGSLAGGIILDCSSRQKCKWYWELDKAFVSSMFTF